jgi:GGDEF domain-containing protein
MPYVIGWASIQLTTSIGVAVYPTDGLEHGELLQRSDLAMFRNKGDMSSRPSIFRFDQGLVS